MYEIVCSILLDLTKLIVPLIALRIIFDFIRSNIFRKVGVYMQDILYIPDELKQAGYKYVDFGNGYVDLYTKSTFYNESTDSVRLFYNCSPRYLYS